MSERVSVHLKVPVPLYRLVEAEAGRTGQTVPSCIREILAAELGGDAEVIETTDGRRKPAKVQTMPPPKEPTRILRTQAEAHYRKATRNLCGSCLFWSIPHNCIYFHTDTPAGGHTCDVYRADPL